MEALWWNASASCRIPINATVFGNVTNNVTYVTVPNGTDTCLFSGNYDDLCFTGINPNGGEYTSQTRPYWKNNETTNSSYAAVWINASLYDINGTQLWAYNTSCNGNMNNGTRTFSFFDDMTGTFTEKWTTTTGTATFKTIGGKSSVSLKGITIIYSNYVMSGAFVLDARMYGSGTSSLGQIDWFGNTTPTSNGRYGARIDWRSTQKEWLAWYGTPFGTNSDIYSTTGAWANVTLLHNGTGFYNFTINALSTIGNAINTNATSGNLVLESQVTTNTSFTDIRVRDYIPIPPVYLNSTRELYSAGDSTPPAITVASPGNNSNRSVFFLWFNVTGSEALSSAWFSLDGAANRTMANSSGNWNYQNKTLAKGNHSVIFYANDTSGNLNASANYSFYANNIINDCFPKDNETVAGIPAGEYDLAIDLPNTTESTSHACWHFENSQNIIFDCNNHLVGYPTSNMYYNIFHFYYINNLTLKNCRVDANGDFLFLLDVNNSLIVNNTFNATNHLNLGSTLGATNTTFKGNYFYFHDMLENDAFYTAGAQNNVTFTENLINDTTSTRPYTTDGYPATWSIMNVTFYRNFYKSNEVCANTINPSFCDTPFNATYKDKNTGAFKINVTDLQPLASYPYMGGTSYFANITDRISLSDLNGRRTDRNRGNIDTFIIWDVGLKQLSLNRKNTDPLLIGDANGKSAGYNRSDIDSFLLADFNIKSLGFSKAFIDPFMLTDSGARAYVTSRENNDVLYLADNNAKSGEYLRFYFDTLLLADGNARSLSMLRALGDMLSISDANSRTYIGGRANNDIVLLADYNNKLAEYTRNDADAIYLLDAVNRNIALMRGNINPILLTDANARQYELARGDLDSLTLMDSNGRNFALSRKDIDELLISDNIKRSTSSLRTKTDSILMSDVNTKSSQHIRLLIDPLLLIDTNSRIYNISRSNNDAAIISDYNGRTESINRNGYDTISLTDYSIKSNEYSRSDTDYVSLLDANTKSTWFNVRMIDMLSFGDFGNWSVGNFVKHYFANYTDSLSFGDYLSRMLGAAPIPETDMTTCNEIWASGGALLCQKANGKLVLVLYKDRKP